MAKSYVKISSNRGEIRKFGGSQEKVWGMVSLYKKMSLAEFMMKHQHLTQEDYESLRFEIGKKN